MVAGLAKPIFLIAFCASAVLFAQQNEEFRTTKKFFDYQRLMLDRAFSQQLIKEKKAEVKVAARKDYAEFMVKLDSIQNHAFINTLIKVKNREDLQWLETQDLAELELKNPPREALNQEAQYPGGFETLRSQVADLFYSESVLADQALLKTNIAFQVEKDGSISHVQAEGDNFTFNRQAEIAMYLLPSKFSPAKINGDAVLYRFRLPLSMRFD